MRQLAPFISLLVALVVAASCGGNDAASTTAIPSPRPATATSTATRAVEATATDVPPAEATDTPRAPPPPTPSTGAASAVRRGDASRRAVTLTFDAGSDTGFATQILDTLSRNGIVAAFGITGKWAQENPQLVQRIVSEGHSIINHSFDHASFTGSSTGNPPLTQEQRWYQIDRTESIINDLTGATTKPYFRPPYGDYDDSVNADVGAHGYAYNVMWTIDSRGWQGKSADEIVERCLSEAEPGAIYIFHVGSASQDGSALQRVIDGLRADGYSFVSLAELIGS